MADEDFKSPSERRKARNEQKKNIKKEVNGNIVSLVKELDDVFSATNRLIPSKINKPETLEDGTVFDKKYVIELQYLYKSILEDRIRDLLSKSTTPQVREPNRNRNYSRPCYFKDNVVKFILDKNVSFKANDVTAMINGNDGETQPYEGQELADILTLTQEGNISILDADEKEIQIPVRGLANRAILGDLLNCYMIQKGLKGVEVTVKKQVKGEEVIEKKINNSYWRIDDTLLKYFGDVIDEIVEKERKKAGGKTPITEEGIEISRHCIKNGAMAIMSAMVDTEMNNRYKNVFDSELQTMINTDADVTRAVYHRIAEEIKKKK